MIDERKGRPSASKFKRYRLCPGSRMRADWLPDLEPESKDATSGTEIHEAHETGDSSGLDQAQTVTFEKGQDQEKLILSRYVELHGEPDILKREHRFWCRDRINLGWDDSLDMEYSGQVDMFAVWLDAGVLLVGDHKSGWVGADDAVDNDQVAALIVAAMKELEEEFPQLQIKMAVASMFQPNAPGGLSVAEFDVEKIDELTKKVAVIYSGTIEYSNVILPGKTQCQYCPAKRFCPEALESMEVLGIQKRPGAEMDTPNRMAEFLNIGDIAASVHKANREKAKELMVEKGWKIPGWEIQESKGRGTIKAEQVLQRLKDRGAADKALWGAVSITKKSVEKLIGLLTMTRGKALQAEVSEVLEGCVVEGKPTKKLVRARS